ncbi:hypothetical protein AB0C14_37570 [Microbispora hainanensis]|uniref:hypothetical protein n=1 Tax=Microbispora hainanensis TaxID=568844 RepID=UPI0033CF922E
MRQLAQDRAIVLVTHNLANAAVADRIVIMADGRVTAKGTFSELISQPGLFRDLWLLQQDRGIPSVQEGNV